MLTERLRPVTHPEEWARGVRFIITLRNTYLRPPLWLTVRKLT